MDGNVKIGKLTLMKRSKWERLKDKYPFYSTYMEYAVVKDLDDEDMILIEEDRLNMVINGRQVNQNMVKY